MMDFSPLYDDDVHPCNFLMKRDWSGPAKRPLNRTLRPVKYYHIDFGHSLVVGNDTPQVAVGYGGDRTVPEFSTQEYCDPFAVDVYRVANLIRETFIDVSSIPLF